MGKGVLIFVMASSLSLGAMYMAGTENDLESAQNEADYKEELLARETAQSAYNIVSSKVRRSFDSYRGAYTDLSYGKATYDIGAVEADDGSVTIIAVGKFGNHEYEIVGSVSRSAQTVVDAITVAAPMADVSFSGDASVTGVDAAVGGSNVHGILATNPTAYQSFLDDAEHVHGRGGSGDIIQGDPQISIANIRASITNYVGDARVTVSSDVTWDEEDGIGSTGNPAIVVVSGNVTLEDGFRGYGALFVEGDLSLADNATWNGLVYIAGSESSFRMQDTSSINGALIIDGVDSGDEVEPNPINASDRGLPGGHFDVDVFDSPNSSKEIYHEHQYDDKYDVRGIDLLSSGCKKPGLCWDQILGGVSGDVTISTMNSGSSSGTYELVVGGTSYTGSSTEALNLTVDPRDVTTFTYDFDSLCSLAPSKPSDVQDDASGRNGALSIQVHSVNSGNLLYEVAVYHHWKENKDGSGPCGAAPAAAETQWVSASGKSYSGDDGICVSEDDNDNYSDWSERTSMWGNRQRKGSGKSDKSAKSSKKSAKSSKKSDKSDKSDKSSKKSDKSSKKSAKSSKKSDKSSKKSDKSYKSSKKSSKDWANDADWYTDVFWANNGKCAKSNENENIPVATMTFDMEDDASVTYNSAALKRLRAMLAAFDMSDGTPVARRMATTTYKDGEMVKATDSDVREVEMTGTKLENDGMLKDARTLLKN